MENFSKIPSHIFEGIWIYMSWPKLVKIGCWEVAEKSSRFADKNLAARDSSKPRILRPLGRSRAKFPERCRLMTCARVPTFFGSDRLGFAGIVPERSIFRTSKVITTTEGRHYAVDRCCGSLPGPLPTCYRIVLTMRDDVLSQSPAAASAAAINCDALLMRRGSRHDDRYATCFPRRQSLQAPDVDIITDPWAPRGMGKGGTCSLLKM